MKNYLLKGTFIVCTCFMLGSCATLLTKKQTITVNSDVDGAEVYKGNKFVGLTPLTFKTKSTKNTFTLRKEGYMDQTINADVNMRWNTMWNYFNGFLGWFVDLGTGATRKYTKTDYFISLKNPEVNTLYNQKHEQFLAVDKNQVMDIVLTSAAQGLAAAQEQENIKKQQELAQLQQKRQALLSQQLNNKYAINKSKSTTRPIVLSNQSLNNKKVSGNCDDLLTSDPIWNQKIQMYLHTYGEEATRKYVAEYRTQMQQQNQNKNFKMNSQANNSLTISAVTLNREQVFIKVSGRNITHYSNKVGFTNKREWNNVLPNATVQHSSMIQGGNSELAKEFNCAAYLFNTIIYFNYDF